MNLDSDCKGTVTECKFVFTLGHNVIKYEHVWMMPKGCLTTHVFSAGQCEKKKNIKNAYININLYFEPSTCRLPWIPYVKVSKYLAVPCNKTFCDYSIYCTPNF